MLKVIVEIHPFGDETAKKNIADIYIGNMGTIRRTPGDALCEYHVWVDEDPRGVPPYPAPHARLQHYRSLGCGPLIEKIMADPEITRRFK